MPASCCPNRSRPTTHAPPPFASARIFIVSSVSAPAVAGAGDDILISDTTKNSGGAEATESATEFYLSANSTIDGSDVRLGSRAVAVLVAGGTSSATTALTVPVGTAAGGYYIVAGADALLDVAETSETNNVRASAAIKIGPDLVVSSLTAPSTAEAGATLSVADTLKNQGGSSSGATDAVFYLSTNTSIDAADIELGRR